MADALRMSACLCIRGTAIFTACVLGSAPAIAIGWQQSIAVPMTIEFDSNPTLASNNTSTKLHRTRFVPDYRLSGVFGTDQIGAGIAVQIERSSDRSVSLPRQDPSLFLSWQRQTKAGEFGLSSKYQEASTSSSELNETGLIVRDGTRKTQSLSGNWRSNINEHSSLGASADRVNVAYDSGTLTNYTNTSVSLNYNYAWSERIEPFLRMATSRYAPAGAIGTSSSNKTLTGGLQVKISENLDLTAQAGISKVSSTGSSVWQGGASLHHRGSSQATMLEFSRGNNASGAGGYIESDTLKGGWNYSIDARTQSGLDLSRVTNKGIVANTMTQIGAWVSRELSPRWIGRLNYQYRQRQQSGSADASSGLLGFSLIYSHPDF